MNPRPIPPRLSRRQLTRSRQRSQASSVLEAEGHSPGAPSSQEGAAAPAFPVGDPVARRAWHLRMLLGSYCTGLGLLRQRAAAVCYYSVQERAALCKAKLQRLHDDVTGASARPAAQSLDVRAAKRFVEHSLPALNEGKLASRTYLSTSVLEQRVKLRRSSSHARRSRTGTTVVKSRSKMREESVAQQTAAFLAEASRLLVPVAPASAMPGSSWVSAAKEEGRAGHNPVIAGQEAGAVATGIGHLHTLVFSEGELPDGQERGGSVGQEKRGAQEVGAGRDAVISRLLYPGWQRAPPKRHYLPVTLWSCISLHLTLQQGYVQKSVKSSGCEGLHIML
eukprot:SM000246S08215  [mRNA]  locus=s246:116418:118037:- [translate_table: standard]